MIKKILLTFSLLLAITISFAQQRSTRQRQGNQTQLSQQKKSQQLTQEALERTFYSDRGRVQAEALMRYNTWNKKGEFEKLIDYQERSTKNAEAAYKEFCYNIIISALADVEIYKRIGKYDSEKEFFPITFWVSNFNIPQISPRENRGISNDRYRTALTFNLSVPISNAQSFKDNFETLQVDVKPDDWNYLDKCIFPTKLQLIDPMSKKSYICEFPKGEKITHSLINMATGNYMEFDYSSAVNKVMQKYVQLTNVKDLARQNLKDIATMGYANGKTNLDPLKELNGKRLSMQDLFSHNLLEARIKKMLGLTSEELIAELAKVRGFFDLVGNELIFLSPNSKTLAALLIISLDNNLIYLGVRHGNKLLYYTEVDEDGQNVDIHRKISNWGSNQNVN